MSRREFDRSAIMARVVSGSISLTEATPLLCISYRQAKRLYARYKARGASGLIHAGAGRISNRAHPLVERQMVISLVRAHYGGEKRKGSGQRFGPTLSGKGPRTSQVKSAGARNRRWPATSDSGYGSRQRSF